MRTATLWAGIVALAGCTSIEVRPVASTEAVRLICIEENPKVAVGDFLFVLRDGVQRAGLAVDTYRGERPTKCEYRMTYTALQSWDLTTYLSHAELRLDRAGRDVGAATFHLKGKGGLSLAKWDSTKEKMDPVIDQLLANIKPAP